MRKEKTMNRNDGDSSHMSYPAKLTLIPVHIDRHAKQQPIPQSISLWQHCIGWLRYYSIQARWDIERWWARCMGRRWGG